MIREAGPPDGPALASLLRRSPQAGRLVLAQDRTPDFFARRRQLDDHVTLLAEGPGGPDATATVGTKLVEVDGRPVTAAYVLDVAVAAEARRRGRARALLEACHTWAEARGAEIAYAHVMAGNEPSLGTFGRSGYRVATGVRVAVALPRGRGRPPGGARPASQWSDGEWDRAAGLLASAGAGHDLRRVLDGPGLRALWTRLAGWDPATVWCTDRAVLGLWDHSAVSRAELVEPLPLDARVLRAVTAGLGRARLRLPLVPDLGRPLHYGVTLGGAGDPHDLGVLLRAALAAARARGLHVVMMPSDARRRPRWVRRLAVASDHLHVVVRPLSGSAAAGALGRRPLWPDPLDL